MREFGDIFEAVNKGIEEGYGDMEEADDLPEEENAQEIEGMPAAETEGEVDTSVLGDVLGKLTSDSIWDTVLTQYAEEHDMDLEAVKSAISAALEAAGIQMPEPEVEVEVSVEEMPAELEQELPEQE